MLIDVNPLSAVKVLRALNGRMVDVHCGPDYIVTGRMVDVHASTHDATVFVEPHTPAPVNDVVPERIPLARITQVVDL